MNFSQADLLFPASPGVLQQNRGLSVPHYWNVENLERAGFKSPLHKGQYRSRVAFVIATSQ